MLINILSIVIGIVLVLWGADRLTDGSVAVAERLGIPQIVIGLTIVARSMAIMQGTLQIENGTPNGLSFTMTFPLVKEE